VFGWPRRPPPGSFRQLLTTHPHAIIKASSNSGCLALLQKHSRIAGSGATGCARF
jgi:hypothetical protein